jgi:heptosyltransferase-3
MAAKQILFIRTGGLGDFILSLPVLAALRQAWPDAQIEILGRPSIGGLGLGPAYADRVTSIDEARFAGLFSGAGGAEAGPLAAYLSRFDLAVSFLGAPDSDFARALGALVKRVLFIAAPAPGQGHACRQFIQQLAPLGIAPADWRPRVYVEPERRVRARQLLDVLGRPEAGAPVLVHPGSGSPRKNWAPARFAGLIARFREARFDVAAIVGEADEVAARSVQDQLGPQALPILEQLPLPELAGVLNAARLFVGNDSGVSHLAAAVGAPALCFFGPTDPAVWAPVGEPTRVLRFGEATPESAFRAALEILGLPRGA